MVRTVRRHIRGVGVATADGTRYPAALNARRRAQRRDRPRDGVTAAAAFPAQASSESLGATLNADAIEELRRRKRTAQRRPAGPRIIDAATAIAIGARRTERRLRARQIIRIDGRLGPD